MTDIGHDAGMTSEAEDVRRHEILQRRSRWKNLYFGTLLPILSGLAGLAVWEFVVWAMDIPDYLLPPPSMVFETMFERWSTLMSHLWYTTVASVTGFAIALMLGVVIGAAITASRAVDRVLYPWLVIAHAIPKVVVAPLLLIWIGFGLKSGIIFVVVFSFFPIVVNTVMGLKSAEPDLLHLVRSMGATRLQTMWKIRIPTALPHLFSGIKIAATGAPVGAVIGEFVASNQGLGYALIQAVGNLDTDYAFASVIIISVFGVAIWYLAELVERLSIPWHASQR
ncbi:MAG: ABC transporter permease [Kiloniellales bacterium]|nr:ABC transporter permease [Kiloniellales bacterium]